MTSAVNTQVTYIVITMNRRDAVVRCLTELRKQQLYSSQEVILVDNGSSDGTPDVIEATFKEVKVIRAGENLGVAGARNLGFRQARGEFLIFIDDDAEFSNEQATKRTLEIFQESPEVAVVGFAILTARTGLPERAAIARVDKKMPKQRTEAAYFCGCGFAMRRTMIPAQGPFWDELIYSCEELDASYGLMAADRKIIFAPDISVLHWKDPRGRPSGQFIYFNARNRLFIALRWLPLPAVITTLTIWWLYLLALAIGRGHLMFLIRGVVDGLKQVRQLWRRRTPLSIQTLSRLQELSGRVWF